MRRIRQRIQRHAFGCGLACVAAIADKSYATVVRDFHRLSKGKVEKKIFNGRWIIDYGTTQIEVHNLLKKYGIRTGKRCMTYKGKKHLPELSLLEVMLRKEVVGNKREDCWHWVLARRVGNRVLIFDPLNGRRTLKSLGPVYGYLKIYV